MLRSTVLALVGVFCFVTFASASDLDGRWTGTIDTPNGEITLVYTFKVSGETLTGGITTPRGELPINNGKISGNEFSFSLAFGEMNIDYKGKLDGDSVQLISSGPQGERVISLKRAPAE